MIGIAVALDPEIDFQVILQKSSILHNSYIEKHLDFLSGGGERGKGKTRQSPEHTILLNKPAIV